jgi:hypothetical protein
MRKLLVSLLVPAAGAFLFTGSPAEAAPPPDSRGACVSGSPTPTGAPGRSEIARNGCPTPPPAALDCDTNGTVDLNEETDTVTLTANAETLGSSLECTIDTAVTAGDTLTFTYDLSDGVTCGGGVPRLFITIDGQTYNTFDDATGPLAGACGTGGAIGEATSGTVTYTIPVSGTATTVGLVYDFSTGSVVYSDVTLAGEELNF